MLAVYSNTSIAATRTTHRAPDSSFQLKNSMCRGANLRTCSLSTEDWTDASAAVLHEETGADLPASSFPVNGMAWHYPMIDFLKWINSIIWAKREKYRTVIPCACLLTLAAVVAFAIAHDPLGFSLQKWQTLSSAFVALGAATLAYNAAMKRVRFDEQTARENLRRKTLGIFMRYHFAVDVLRYEAKNLLKELPKSASENFSVAVDNLALSELPEIKDAWENLDYFSVRFVRGGGLSRSKRSLQHCSVQKRSRRQEFSI
jgi:hypothetical protein